MYKPENRKLFRTRRQFSHLNDYFILSIFICSYKKILIPFFFLYSRMEETVRTLLQYKSKFEQLKQDRHTVANSYEVSPHIMYIT